MSYLDFALWYKESGEILKQRHLDQVDRNGGCPSGFLGFRKRVKKVLEWILREVRPEHR